MTSFRSDRVAELIKKEISDIISNSVKDPRVIGLITVTGVKVSKDLRHAKVYLSIYGNEEQKHEIFNVLKNAEGYIRREIGHRIRLKFTPDVVLELDESIEHGIEIIRKLKEFDLDEKDLQEDEAKRDY